MNKVDTIDFLNATVRVRLSPSPLHGVGVFAIRDIPEGLKLFLDRAPMPYKVSPGNQSKLFPAVRELLLERWPKMIDGAPFAFPDVHFQGYMNHSDTPNYDATLDIALKDIKAGEEITEDYRLIHGWERAYPWLVRDTI